MKFEEIKWDFPVQNVNDHGSSVDLIYLEKNTGMYNNFFSSIVMSITSRKDIAKKTVADIILEQRMQTPTII